MDDNNSGIEVTAFQHVGIRVAERQRSLDFYRQLGFAEIVWIEAHAVSILRNSAGLELNLIVNANDDNDGRNVLMDMGSTKYPGYNHISLRVDSIEQTVAALERAGIVITEGPINLGGLEIALFVRDPDRNVVEFAKIIKEY